MSFPRWMNVTLFPAILLGVSVSAASTPVTVREVPEQFADAPAVVLDEMHRWIVWPGKSSKFERRRVRILTREGFDQADQVIFYSATDSRLRGFKARTVLPDGTSRPVTADIQQDAVVWKTEDLEIRSLRFTFPAVEVGATLEWEYERKLYDRTHLRWWDVQRDIPVMESHFEIRFKRMQGVGLRSGSFARVEFDDHCERLPATQTRTDMIQSFVCRDVPALEIESLAPPTWMTRQRFLMGWWPSRGFRLRELFWKSRAERWWNQIARLSSGSAELKPIVNEIVEGAATETEILGRIYSHVQENVEIWFDATDENSGTATTVVEVLERGGGSPVEVTALIRALLRNAGVQADLVLVGDRIQGILKQSMPDPGQPLNLILQVETDGEKGFLDPSCRFCQPGLLDWRHSADARGSFGMHLRKTGGTFSVVLGRVPAKFNSQQYNEKVVLQDDGSARVSGLLQLFGHEDVETRRVWVDLTVAGRSDSVRQGIAGDIYDVSITPSDPEALDRVLQASYHYGRDDLALVTGEQMLIRPPDVFSRNVLFPVQEERTQPVWWPFERSVRAEVSVELPSGYVVADLPDPLNIEGPNMTFGARWSRDSGDGQLKWVGQFQRHTVKLETYDYDRAREFFQELQKHLWEGAVVKKIQSVSNSGAQ